MSLCCECCLLSGRGLCIGLITPPEESYRLWCVVCDLETSNEEALAHWGVAAPQKRGGGYSLNNRHLKFQSRYSRDPRYSVLRGVGCFVMTFRASVIRGTRTLSG